MGTRKSDMTRRGFLTTSLTGLAAAGLVSVPAKLAWADEQDAGESAGAEKPGKQHKSGEIHYRNLGKTGMSVPVVGMGVMNSSNPEVVQASYEIGIRHFDTAARYQFGRNEQMVGEVIAKLKARDKVVIATKELLPSGYEEMTAGELKAKFIKLTEGSLKRLKTDYVDILYIHNVQSVEALNAEGAFEALAQLKRDGKVRATGVSTHQAMAEIIDAVAEAEMYDVVLTAFNVSMAGYQELLDAVDKAAANGIGVVAMKTQAGGRSLPNQDAFRNYESATINKAMLKWALRHESISMAIPGFTNFEHLEQDFSVAYGLEYTEDEKRFLADNELQVGLGYCRQCTLCMATCPNGADIPSLMRTHMYAAQYSNFSEARSTLDEIAPGRGLDACGSCGKCTAQCANAVDIGYRIDDLKLIYA